MFQKYPTVLLKYDPNSTELWNSVQITYYFNDGG